MRKFSLLLVFIFFVAGMETFAQITITENDLQSYINLGNTLSVLNDTTTTQLDIGGTGATSWDFSGLSSDLQFTITSVNPSGTPLGNHFPSAQVSFYDTTTIQGYLVEYWLYLGLNNAVLNYGSVGQGSVSGFQVTLVSHNNPAAKNLVLPLTMGTNWSEDYVRTDSTITSPLPTTVTTANIHDENMVDAYGTMKLPGGATVPALRLRTDEMNTSQASDGSTYSRTISYLFLTSNGTQISVQAADTTSPNTGVIPVSDISFINAGITDVKTVDNTIPENFNLRQNYPNPFNPTTQINYSIPSSQKVVLKVYDELGKEVATLVNKDQSAGNYSVDFNASNLASGVYFYRLQAGNFIQMKKMILMK
jgi:hypothetical protein